MTGTFISSVSVFFVLVSTLVLLFLEFSRRIRLLFKDFGRLFFFSRELDDETFFRFCFLSFFFGRRGGGVGMNDPEPANFSSCSFVKSERRSSSDIVLLVVLALAVVVLNDSLGRLRVGLPDPTERPEGVGAKLSSSVLSFDSSDSSDSSGRGGFEIEIISRDRPLGVGANSNAFGCGSTFCCSSFTSSGIGFNIFSFGK